VSSQLPNIISLHLRAWAPAGAFPHTITHTRRLLGGAGGYGPLNGHVVAGGIVSVHISNGGVDVAERVFNHAALPAADADPVPWPGQAGEWFSRAIPSPDRYMI
jgi:hypothetical protein